MALHLHNTLTRKKELFEPGDPNRVTMYVCGPTVYNLAHIGNARPVVVFDILYRLLRLQYPNVIYARNITDVDDKIMAAATEEGCTIEDITQRFTEAYAEDMGSLNTLQPDLIPHATAHIGEMIAMIETLIEKDHAYAAQGHVLFRVDSYKEYGKLSGRSVDEMIAGARVEVAPYKQDPADFVLWKPSSDDQVGWDSPWGRGRPGWHIECSAMSAKHLGKTIDIHGGGNDLTFPHHENELAQSNCAHGQVFARYWVHNGLLTTGQAKMSKSVGNIKTVRQLRSEYPPEVLRFTLMSAHYRQPLEWSEQALEQSRSTLDRLYRALQALADVTVEESDIVPRPSLVAALEDDLNTPKAIAEICALAGEIFSDNLNETTQRKLKGELLGSARLLGILAYDPVSWFRGDAGRLCETGLDAVEVDQLIARRNEARNNKDWGEADRIRDELAAAGILLEDKDGKTIWRRKS